MEVAKMIISFLLIIDCIVLTIVVLMQEGKEAGLGSISGMADTYWGKNKGRSMEGTCGCILYSSACTQPQVV